MSRPNKKKRAYTTISIDSTIGETFRLFAGRAGMSMQAAAERALRRWMLEGYKTDLQEFLTEHKGDSNE